MGYEGGEYVVVKQAGSSVPWAVAWRDSGGWFENFYAEIDARMVSPLAGAYLFVTFRGQDLSSWYSFTVDPYNRTFGLFQAGRGNISPLINLTTSALINGGTGRNRLGIRADGAAIVLYINGQEVGRTTDNTYQAGYLSFGTGHWSGGRSEARFSNLVVSSTN